jgi:hypothetical protein
MNKKLWYVVTEEGIEGSGQENPLAALVEYIELSEVTEERIDEIISGDSEINHVQAYSREELDTLPEV